MYKKLYLGYNLHYKIKNKVCRKKVKSKKVFH